MPKLIRLEPGEGGDAPLRFVDVDDAVAVLATGEEPQPGATTLVPLDRFRSEGAGWLDAGIALGVRIASDERVEELAYDLPRLALVALDFPIFRDGRAYSSAAILRGRLGFRGELRAVGEVGREQAPQMIRSGFDAFAPKDGSTAADWQAKSALFRHVYQPAADGRAAAWDERTLSRKEREGCHPHPPGLSSRP